MRTIYVIVLALFLSACASPPSAYVPLNEWGEGYTETQLETNVFRVSFHANASTRADYAEDMTLLRSAEVTQDNGFMYFVISNGTSRSDGTISDGSGVGTGFQTSRSTSLGSYASSSSTSSKPSTTNTIVCYKDKPENTSGMVYNASFIINSIEKKYQIESETQRIDMRTKECKLKRWQCR
ncbi:CC0125/CC1285 family lipoprotein [Sideroxydans lithotrophicus]|uniref:Lipoprotein n=1 Tax=Sideroxydans lithotrophicus (strain ES-1) TaxID=580332 RepID=D5CPR9_SIDLE|nr:hypothetical protein [Sideroxydans lithotrophicus]ADE13064.1 conserved hypothetical protein [Sideroxydans lithotrophicus ES-1]